MTKNILCFGDSIIYGYGDLEGGWVARLRKRIDLNSPESDPQVFFMTYNLGIPSDTSRRLMDRFELELAAYTRDPADNYLIISIGTNDAIRNTSDKSLWTELPQYKANITALINQAQAAGAPVVFLGNMPVDETKTHPYVYDATIESSNHDIKTYELTAQQACKENDVDFIPVFEKAIQTDYPSMLSGDGVHPNAKGHAYLAWEYINGQKWLRV